MKKPVEIHLGQSSTILNMTQFCATAHDLFLYDIPARFKEEEVVKAIQGLRTINKITFKRQYKYQIIKVNMNL